MSQIHPSFNDGFFEEVVTAAAEGILAVDDSGTVVFTNPSAERLFGYDPGELLGRSLDRLVHADEPTASDGTPDDLVTDPDATGRPLELVRADGRQIPAEVTVGEREFEGMKFSTVTLRPVEEADERSARECTRCAALFENSNDPVVEFEFRDQTPTFVAVNEAFEGVFGFEATEVVGRSIADVIVPAEENETHHQLVESVLREERVTSRVHRRTAEGDREFLLRVAPFRTDGEPVGGYAIFTDITDQREREKELRETSERLETIFDHANDAILIVDPERHDIKDSNRSTCELLGYTYEELRALDLVALQPTESAAVTSFVEEVSKTGVSETSEIRFVASDGEVVPAEVSASVIELDGQPHVLMLARDISERVERDRELRRYKEVINTVGDAIYQLDQEGNIVAVTDVAIEQTGYAREELVGANISLLLDEEDIEKSSAVILDLLADEDRRTGTLRFDVHTADGEAIPCEAEMTVLVDGDEFLGTTGLVRDISDQKAYVGKLEALNETGHDLMVATSTDEIARLAVETVDRVLGFDVSCIRLFDTETNRLEPVAMTPEAAALVESCRAFDLESSLAGRAYRRSERVDGVIDLEDDRCLSVVAGANVHLPLDERGTLSVFSDAPTFDDLDLHHLELLAANVSTAVDRTERADTLEQNEHELRQQHAELETLNQINALVSELIGQLVGKTTREEIYRTVCDRLAASEFYESAWIGAVETANSRVTPVAGSGIDDGYLDVLETLPVGYLAHGAVAASIETGRLELAHQYPVGGYENSSRQETETGEPIPDLIIPDLVASVPLTYGGRTHGVLVVEAAREDVFSETAQTGFEVLGNVVGFVINAALNRELLLSDVVVELEFDVTDPQCMLATMSRELDCRCSLEKVTPLGDGDYIVYVQVEGAASEDALQLVSEMAEFVDWTVVRETDGEFLLELTTADTVVPTLMELGASAPTVVAENGEGRLTVEVLPTTNVREILGALRELYPSAELLRKQELNRPVRTAAEFHEHLEDRLTDKQLVALQTAHVVGFYDWPRQRNAKEIAASLGISAPTFHQHLRKAEQKLVEAFFDESGEP